MFRNRRSPVSRSQPRDSKAEGACERIDRGMPVGSRSRRLIATRSLFGSSTSSRPLLTIRSFSDHLTEVCPLLYDERLVLGDGRTHDGLATIVGCFGMRVLLTFARGVWPIGDQTTGEIGDFADSGHDDRDQLTHATVAARSRLHD